mmetsp:Transcript_25756/g.55801  ORF Transcript_25756/g.55801 Transcript_25756/m.55801 type:complete len:353 (-) Transcript_25756:75-1133(-)
MLLLLLAAFISPSSSYSNASTLIDADLLHVRDLASYSNNVFTVSSQNQHRDGGRGACPLSGKKLNKFCKKSCKSKSSPKCNKRKKRLKECCDQDCDCKDVNKEPFVDIDALIERCNELGGGPPSPDIDATKEKRRFRKRAKQFKTAIGRSYSFESRRGSDGIWGDWMEYVVVDGEFVTSLSEDEFFGECSPVCKTWSIEDMFDAISVGIENFPLDQFEIFTEIVLYDVKYSGKKGFPRHFIISPIQVIPVFPSEDGEGPGSFEDPSGSVGVDGGLFPEKLMGELGQLKSSDPEVQATKELAEAGVSPANEDLLPGDLGLSLVEDSGQDTCRPLEIQVRRVKILKTPVLDLAP